MQTIGVIGGSGFIGSYVTRRFLDAGARVRVSATDLTQPGKYDHLRTLRGSERLEILPLNVTDRSALQAFLSGCDTVVHGGTPFQLAVADAQRDMLDPTIKGTELFLELASQTPGLTAVVIIASVAAFNTAFPMPVPGRPPDHVYTEADEPFHSADSIPYAQAKYFADQAVRRWVAAHPDTPCSVVSLCPTLVAGPALSTRPDSTSQGFQSLVKQRLAPDDLFSMLWEHDVAWAVVDVEDVAEAVYRAATTPGLHGRTYLLSADSWTMSDLHRLLNRQAPAGSPRVVYSSAAATRDLGITFKSGRDPLTRFAALP